jgi:hypothetical protein
MLSAVGDDLLGGQIASRPGDDVDRDQSLARFRFLADDGGICDVRVILKNSFHLVR